MSPKTLSPNISIRLKTSSGLRRERPLMRRLTSPWTPRTETRWPRPPERARHLRNDLVVLLRVFVFAVEVRQNGNLHARSSSDLALIGEIHAPTGERDRHPPYLSSVSWNSLSEVAPRASR